MVSISVWGNAVQVTQVIGLLSQVTSNALLFNLDVSIFQISNSYFVSDVLSDSSGVAMVMLWCCHGDVLSDSSGVAMVTETNVFAFDDPIQSY